MAHIGDVRAPLEGEVSTTVAASGHMASQAATHFGSLAAQRQTCPLTASRTGNQSDEAEKF
jgi:hypothetical protein